MSPRSLSGIHRNLGVHISKVKSVSLDSWTAELVAGMKEMGGNTKANEIYEAYLPGMRYVDYPGAQYIAWRNF